jgi:uncharacterized protein YaaN involved in tellurite resistance
MGTNGGSRDEPTVPVFIMKLTMYATLEKAIEELLETANLLATLAVFVNQHQEDYSIDVDATKKAASSCVDAAESIIDAAHKTVEDDPDTILGPDAREAKTAGHSDLFEE